MKFSGNVWKFGDDIDTDQIIASQYLVLSDKRAMARHAMETQDPDFSNKFKAGDIIVGGKNFGCGSSRQQAPEVLKQLGAKVIIAESFARIFFRNSINLGILLIEIKNTSEFKTGDHLLVSETSVKNDSTGEKSTFQPLTGFLKQIIEQGGLVNKIKNDQKKTKIETLHASI